MTTLDTSGVVKFEGGTLGVLSWEGLGQIGGPFAQGYVEALLDAATDIFGLVIINANHKETNPGFSDLAPEARAMILRDCGERYAAFSWHRPSADASERKAGAMFWEQRQRAEWIDRLVHPLPPLRVYLNGAGKVMLEVAK